MFRNSLRNYSPIFICFIVAGFWAGVIVSTVITTSAMSTISNGVSDDQQAGRHDGLFGRRGRPRGERKNPKEEPRTESIEEGNAPGMPVKPIAESGTNSEFVFPQPVVPPVTDPPNPGSNSDNASNTLQAVIHLLDGEGDMDDILTIVTTLFALFGGFKFAGSDNFLRVILSLFSKKSNFNAILQERTTNRRTRKSRK